MTKIFNLFKKSYILIILLAMYIPLMVGMIYSFSSTPNKGDMSHVFNYSGSGWSSLWNDSHLGIRIMASLVISLIVSFIVVLLSLITVFGLWRSKSKAAKGYVVGTYQVPLINPDVITGVILMLAFGSLFGILRRGDEGIERVIIAQSVMIIPFGITIMYPKSEKFSPSMFEASKDLGYGPIRTWFKTYFRHMIGVMSATFIVSMALSFDDFIITKTTSKIHTIGTKMYSESLRPWVLALGTIIMAITLSGSTIFGILIYIKNRKRDK